MEAAKVRLLTKQLLIYTDEFGWKKIGFSFTTFKKKTSPELQKRFEEILVEGGNSEYAILGELKDSVRKLITKPKDGGYETIQIYEEITRWHYKEEQSKTLRGINVRATFTVATCDGLG